MSNPQTQVVLRVRSEAVALRLREQLQSEDADEVMEVQAEDPVTFGDVFVAQRMVVTLAGEKYPARLVNLPTIVETHKTFDGSTYYKCGDVSQALVVYESEAERARDEARKVEGAAWQTYYPDGLSPPLRDVVARRFSKARRAAKEMFSHEEVNDVEDQMVNIVANQGKQATTSELLCEDVVPFQDWMTPDQGATVKTIGDDTPIAAKHPWILVDSVGAAERANKGGQSPRPPPSTRALPTAVNVGLPTRQPTAPSPHTDGDQPGPDVAVDTLFSSLDAAL